MIITKGTWVVGAPSGSGQPDSVKKYKGKPYREHHIVQATNPSTGFVKGIAHIYQGDADVGSPEALAEQHANALLIAAAPDLLAACEAALTGNLDMLRAAIAKAKGM